MGLCRKEPFGAKKKYSTTAQSQYAINTITLQEAKSSSAIENIFTTDDELYRAISDTTKDDHITPATKEVLRYREAIWTGFNAIKESGEISIKSVVGIFQKIKNTSQKIRPPQSQVVIRKGQSDTDPGVIEYTPPRGDGVIEEKLENLIKYLNDNETYPEDPLLKMAIAHYQFEAIHPFIDGNGRVGRILNILYLVQQGMLTYPALYMSRFIIANKSDYYYHLGAVTQRQQWKNWLIFMLTSVEETSKNTNQLIDSIIDQMNATLEYGKRELKWYTKEINEVLFNQPYLKQKIIGEVVGRTSRTTLTKYMSDLSHLGIVTPKQEGKEVFYINNDLVRILQG